MAEKETGEETPLTEVKFIRAVDYKGVGFAKGTTAKLEPHIADRLIADGNAAIVETEPKGKKK